MDIQLIIARLKKAEAALESVDPKGCTHNEKCQCPRCEFYREFPFSIDATLKKLEDS